MSYLIKYMNKIMFLSNEYCWAVYLNTKLLTWDRHGDDPVFGLKRIGQTLGFTVEHGELPELDGGEPNATI